MIKEGDLELIRDDLPGFKKPPRTPVRVVLNNSTLSIFQTDNFADILFSVTLKELQLLRQDDDVNCIRVANVRSGQSKGICAMALSKESQADQIRSWTKNINMFKSDCMNILVAQRAKQVSSAVSADPLVQQKLKALENEKQSVQADAYVDPTLEIQDSFKDIKGNLVNALGREMKFEQLVEQEEVEQQAATDKSKLVKLEKLKENEQCLERQERKNNNLERTEIERTGIADLIANLKSSVKQMILTQRSKESNKIRVMRKLKEKQEADEDSEISDIRSHMSAELAKTYKKGDEAHCIAKHKDDLSQELDTEPYCKGAYADNVQDYQDCVKPDNFCVYCCLAEFGTESRAEREDCLHKCIELDDDAHKEHHDEHSDDHEDKDHKDESANADKNKKEDKPGFF